MAIDLLIRNVTLVASTGRRLVDISIANGRFAGLLAPGSTPIVPAAQTINGTGLHALPGLVDGHVHFREPGLTHEETWLTGTRAAVYGGVTTVLEMPNTMPPTDTVDRAREKLALADASAYCDYGIFGLLGESAANARALAGCGLVVGLKAFLGPTTGNLLAPDDDGLRSALEAARDSGLRVCFHAEDRDAIRDDAPTHLEARPAAAEVAAIDRVGALLLETRAAGHILHVSSADGLLRIAAWRENGADLTCEVTPHHALLDREVYERVDGVAKVNPPIRGEPDASALLTALADGRIDAIASDHAPHLEADKRRDSAWEVPAGFAGVETLLPLMLTEVAAGRLTLERLVEATSARPAQIWGLAPRKGAVELGADADLALVDLERTGTISAANLHGMNNLSPFEGRITKGAVVATIVRGRVVMRDGELLGQPGWGNAVQPVRTNSLSDSTA